MEAAPLHVYNTLTKKKETFTTVVPRKVGMYVCGPTVYKPSHLGHMVGPVIFDTVKRYLQYLGYEVTFVVNITDVDDKLIVESRKQNTTVAELGECITKDYVKNLELLNVTGIDHMPRATQHMEEIIQIIKGLVGTGHAYAAGGDVYFDVTKDEDYGKLCHRDPEHLEAGARIEVNDKKHNPGDFALWKNAKPGEPSWDSPWGKGRPGWHIECSAMSMKLLGKTLDIHGGGLDLQFPHHENELAQSESYTGVPFVRYWMHNGLMKTGTEKMSKSKGNEIVVSELLKRHEPETLRFFLLSTHYRRPIDYSEDRLVEIRRGLDGFYRFFERFQRITKADFFELKAPARRGPLPPHDAGGDFVSEVAGLRKRFLEHMDDDFNTGGAIGILYEILTSLNRFADAKELERESASSPDLEALQFGVIVMKELAQILGIFHQPPKKRTFEGAVSNQPQPSHSATVVKVPHEEIVGNLLKELELLLVANRGQVAVPNETREKITAIIQELVNHRAQARKAKNFALGDQIRMRLSELGVTLEDRPGETVWRIG